MDKRWLAELLLPGRIGWLATDWLAEERGIYWLSGTSDLWTEEERASDRGELWNMGRSWPAI